MNTTVDVYGDILRKLPNIISHLKFHSPDKTSAEEKAVVDQAALTIENCGENRFGLNFILPDYLHAQIHEKLPEVEASLKKKADSVFKYFPQAKVLYVKVKRKQDI